MDQLDTIDGLTETQPDTEPLTARLVEVLAASPRRSQDDLQSSIGLLERACSHESNKRLRTNIEQAIKLLRYGPEGGDSSDQESLYHEE